MIDLPHRFAPRPYQKGIMRAICQQGIKRGICVWHRRAGKDKTFLNIMAIMAAQTMGTYAYFFPTAVLGRKALWDNIDANSGMRVIDHLPPEIVAKTNEQQMKITLVNGSTIQILGTETLDVVGGNPIGVIFSESAQHNPMAWDYIRPILRENGGWCIFNGTPRGKNWLHDLLTKNRENPQWYTEVLSVADTGALTPEDIEEERRSGMREEMIRQEYFCDFSVGLIGAIYADLIDRARAERRLTNDVLWERGALVWTAWDLGAPENTSIWYFQEIMGEIRLIDFDSGLNLGTAERVAHMIAKGYSYGGHLLPHDAEAKQKNSLSFLEELMAAGLGNVRVVPRTHNIWHGITRMREVLPRCRFDATKCAPGIAALEHYHRREGKGYVTNDPVHDWSSHPADACRYIGEGMLHGMVGRAGLSANQGPPQVKMAGHWR